MIRKFEYVKRVLNNGFENVTPDFNLPKRSTKYSSGYDFECIEDITIKPYKFGDQPTFIPTGVKCKMPENEFLMLVNRSSNPKKKNLIIPNSVGIIDSDYYGNQDNDGEIMFAFYNFGTENITIEKGYHLGQGIFIEYKLTDDDVSEGERVGGFGSTNNL